MSVERDKPAAGHYSARERALHALQERIRSGAYGRGAMLPTERQLVLELGVSRPVVRVALQDLAEQGWITRDPGHRPRVARTPPPGQQSGSVRAGASVAATPLQVVAAIMPMDLRYPAAYNIQHGIQRALQRQESAYRLVVFDTLAGTAIRDASGLDADTELKVLETVAQEGIAGAILWQIGGEDTVAAVDALQAAGVPVVLVDRYPSGPGAKTWDFVGVNNRGGAREAVNYLIHLGHRRIAHLTTFGQNREGAASSVLERYEGYREALRENGLPFDPELVGRSGPILAKIQSGGADAPTAVFAVNDASAHSFIERVAAQGYRVPEDLSVIGFDDLDRYSHRTPYLSTMYLPFETVGERAADLLLRRLRHLSSPGEPKQHILLSTVLVVRETCASPKGE